MSTNPALEVLEQQEWLEPVEGGLQKAVGSAFESTGPVGRQVKNFLHGVWLGHPLHPVLTDIPVGSWTAALVLDVMEASGAKDCAAGADLAVKVGLAGAAGAALSGLTDWQATDEKARRLGVIHGLLNTVAAVLYTASAVQRGRRRRESGRLLAYCGYGIAVASAYLGGSLVFTKRIGVNHAIGIPGPSDWTPVLDESELREGEPRRVDVNGFRLLLLRRTGQVYAIGEVCSHLGGPLAEGTIQGDTVQCPWHGSRFCVRDGSVIDGPATHAQPVLDTRVTDGRIEIRARSEE
jgi:nitrite reductase/ring-hydroxylating ferredoxin subunit/uncharacterized membrane protein